MYEIKENNNNDCIEIVYNLSVCVGEMWNFMKIFILIFNNFKEKFHQFKYHN